MRKMMIGAEYLVNTLISYDVTDVFGIPGGVVLDFLYALDSKKDKISPHLCYHEQAAAFAASGYAQVTGTLGVAYATRGPGFTNMITAIADAYQESIPMLIITAHAQKQINNQMRMEMNQEVNTVKLVDSITKYSARVNSIEDFSIEIRRACEFALNGRKGPVLLDFETSLFSSTIPDIEVSYPVESSWKTSETLIGDICNEINRAKRPIILAGAGIQLSNTAHEVKRLAEEHRIPILSSRCSQDLFAGSDLYYGYVGSHATRYSNFILSKADLIIALGNRMSFPIASASFNRIFEHAMTIRVDIDESEFAREIPHSKTYVFDLRNFFDKLDVSSIKIFEEEWINVCSILRTKLCEYDTEQPVKVIAEMMNKISAETVLTCDVGNNEFWISRAYIYAGATNRILYSRSFGALGCSLPKAIGAYYRTRKRIICFAGDQGFQMNIQELQYVVANQLPITIVLLNNQSSGMIRSREKQKFGEYYVHTTINSGYSVPKFQRIAEAYGLIYNCISVKSYKIVSESVFNETKPRLIELLFDEGIDLDLSLPKGRDCQDLEPLIDRELYEKLERL